MIEAQTTSTSLILPKTAEQQINNAVELAKALFLPQSMISIKFCGQLTEKPLNFTENSTYNTICKPITV